MKFDRHIGFEWVVTGVALIGVVALLVVGEDRRGAVADQPGAEMTGAQDAGPAGHRDLNETVTKAF